MSNWSSEASRLSVERRRARSAGDLLHACRVFLAAAYGIGRAGKRRGGRLAAGVGRHPLTIALDLIAAVGALNDHTFGAGAGP